MREGAEGERFLVAFADLKDRTDNSPESLSSRWQNDDNLQNLCDELHSLVRSFRIVEEWSPRSFTDHVPAAAAQARRDYDARWAKAVSHVAERAMHEFLEQLLKSFERDLGDARSAHRPRDALDVEIETWKDRSRLEADHIDAMVEHAFNEREADTYGDFEWVTESLWAWHRLTKICGLDVAEALWRRRAIPHTLIPAHVSNRYRPHEPSLYQRLTDAGRAFIFGAPLAAFAMQRAVLEHVLDRHWGAVDGDMRDVNFPTQSHSVRAFRLRRLGNQALHGKPEHFSDDERDREIIKNFVLLRELIESAPEQVP